MGGHVAPVISAAAMAGGEQATELYDVTDFVATPQDASGSAPAAAEEIDVVEAIQAGLPEVSRDKEASIRSEAGLLEIRASSTVQERVRALIDAMRRDGKCAMWLLTPNVVEEHR